MCSMGTVGRLNRTGMDACRNGRLDEAELNLLAALDLARTKGVGCTEVKLHSNLGIVYELRGQHENAAIHYRSAIEIMSERIPGNHPLHIRLTKSLARIASITTASAES